jgi:hypothetical protein
VPTDSARAELRIRAGVEDVLETIHDVATQPEWIPEIKAATVLDSTEGGLPLRAELAASTAVGTDRYTLAYDHLADGIAWTMEHGRLQTGQEGRLTAEPVGPPQDELTLVTYELTIHHNLPLPGFIRSRTIKGLVTGTLEGLRRRHEGGG